MNLDVSSFRQEVARIKFSKAAFSELLSATRTVESKIQNHRFDAHPACMDPGHSSALGDELRNIREIIDYQGSVLIVDGFKVEALANFESL